MNLEPAQYLTLNKYTLDRLRERRLNYILD